MPQALMTGHRSFGGRWSLANVSAFSPTERDWLPKLSAERSLRLDNAHALDIAGGPGRRLLVISHHI